MSTCDFRRTVYQCVQSWSQWGILGIQYVMSRRRGHIFCVAKICAEAWTLTETARAFTKTHCRMYFPPKVEIGVWSVGQQDWRRESGINLFKEVDSNYWISRIIQLCVMIFVNYHTCDHSSIWGLLIRRITAFDNVGAASANILSWFGRLQDMGCIWIL